MKTHNKYKLYLVQTMHEYSSVGKCRKNMRAISTSTEICTSSGLNYALWYRNLMLAWTMK